MTTAAVKVDAHAAELALVSGDLGKLTVEQRLGYYKAVCDSVGLNPLTRPFDYLTLNSKLVLYAKRDATDQLRRIHGVSVKLVDKRTDENGVYLVSAQATDKDNRVDESTGAVNVAGLKGDALANAYMKAETKAKRRVTLSICGLGMLDETEVETIPGAQHVEAEPPKQIAPAPERPKSSAAPAPNPNIIDAGRKILDTAAATGDPANLKAAWDMLNIAQKEALAAHKDHLKEGLAAFPPAAAPEPGSVEPDEDAEQVERGNIVNELYSIAEAWKTTPKKLLGVHSIQVGHFPDNRPLPSVEQLTLPQLRHLLTLVHQQADLQAAKVTA